MHNEDPRTRPSRSVSDLFADRYVAVETPEHVELGFQLADLGSRFAALLVDGAILILSVLAVLFGSLTLVGWFEDAVGWVLLAGNWAAALLVLFVFALFWGYFWLFEGLRDGQTPGKRLLGIRVVEDLGGPVSLRAAGIRGLLRLLDILAFGAVGGGVAFLHPRTKRLGDLAAGTIVVRDRSGGALPEETTDTRAAGPPRLTDDEFAALHQYFLRRESLPGDVRRSFASRLATRVEDRIEWTRASVSADDFLVALHADELSRRASTSGRVGGISREAAALVRTQTPKWREYRTLLERAERKGLSSLPEDELARFAALYRELAADLARARTYRGSPELIYALERMVAAGHNLIYRVAGRSWSRFMGWLRVGFPALVRRRWKPIAVSAALFYLPAFVVFGAIAVDPEVAYDVVPAGMIARAEDGLAREAAGAAEYVEIESVFMPVMASQLISNNVQVTFLTFAGGILAGLGSAWVLFLNGVMLGGVAGLYDSYGLNAQLWAFVLPHGVLELSAIVIAGGAAIWMGSALLLPGRKRRKDALVERAREAISLMGGVVILLLLAGVIEAFVSPAPLPRAMKFAFASTLGMAFVLYLLRSGIGAERVEE